LPFDKLRKISEFPRTFHEKNMKVGLTQFESALFVHIHVTVRHVTTEQSVHVCLRRIACITYIHLLIIICIYSFRKDT